MVGKAPRLAAAAAAAAIEASIEPGTVAVGVQSKVGVPDISTRLELTFLRAVVATFPFENFAFMIEAVVIVAFVGLVTEEINGESVLRSMESPIAERDFDFFFDGLVGVRPGVKQNYNGNCVIRQAKETK